MSKGLKPPKGVVVINGYEIWTIKEALKYDTTMNRPNHFVFVGVSRDALDLLEKTNTRFWNAYHNNRAKEFEAAEKKRKAKETKDNELKELARLKEKYEKSETPDN